MSRTIIIIISHMIAFAIGQLPVIMLIFYKRLNLSHKYDFQSMLRVIPISVVLIIVSVYKIVYIALFKAPQSLTLNTNASLFFAIAFIACVFLSIYFIIDRGIFHFNTKRKRLILNISAGITVFLAIFTIFQLISQSQENQVNYIDLAINFIYPLLTAVLALSGILSLVFYKKANKSQCIYSIIFSSSIPLIVLDVLFAGKMHILLTSTPYIIYVVIIFLEVFSSATKGIEIKKDDSAIFKEKYDLTDREVEVYALASQGLSNQKISEKLFVSVHTIKTHLQHIFSKLNISNRYQLINFEKENQN